MHGNLRLLVEGGPYKKVDGRAPMKPSLSGDDSEMTISVVLSMVERT